MHPTVLIVPGLRDPASARGGRVVDLGEVGHLNPASGFGEWLGALSLIDELAAGAAAFH